MAEEYESFIATVRNAGDDRMKEITIDKKLSDFMGLEIGDTLKVMIKKVNKDTQNNKK